LSFLWRRNSFFMVMCGCERCYGILKLLLSISFSPWSYDAYLLACLTYTSN
jgi:hypothetical protein